MVMGLAPVIFTAAILPRLAKLRLPPPAFEKRSPAAGVVCPCTVTFPEPVFANNPLVPRTPAIVVFPLPLKISGLAPDATEAIVRPLALLVLIVVGPLLVK